MGRLEFFHGIRESLLIRCARVERERGVARGEGRGGIQIHDFPSKGSISHPRVFERRAMPHADKLSDV